MIFGLAWTSTMQSLTVVLLALMLLQSWKLSGVAVALVAGEFVGSIVLPLLFAARQLRKVGARLPVSQLFATGTGVMVILVVCLGLSAGWMKTQAACAFGLVALSAVTALQLRLLPSVVQSTFWDAIHPSSFKRVFFR
jgi:hypothetical protein